MAGDRGDPGPVAFEDVTVLPMDAERVLRQQTVLVRGGRIQWVGPAAEAAVPRDTRRIPGAGKYLLPGLADMHTHPATPSDLRLNLAHGVTTIRNMFGMPRHLAWRRAIERGELTGPRIYTAGPIIGGSPPRRAWVTSVGTPAQAVAAVDATRRHGYDAVKVYDELSPEAYHAVAGAAAERGLPVYGHVPFRVGLPAALRAGQRSLEHLFGYLEALLPAQVTDPVAARAGVLEHASSFTDAQLIELAGQTRDAGAWNCPTLIVRKRWTQGGGVDGADAAYVSADELAARREAAQKLPATDVGEQMYELYLRTAKALNDADAGLVTGTDSGVTGLLAGFALHEELEVFAEAGIAPFQILRAATSDAARFVDATGEWGVIAPGARADILLLDADPLADISNARRIAGVMAAGRWFAADELRRWHDDAQAAAREPRQPPQVAAELPSKSGSMRYTARQAGVVIASEQVTIEPRPAGGRRLLSHAEVHKFLNEAALPGREAGSYYSVVETDAAGAGQAATFDHDGVDGHQHVELSNDGGRIRVHVSYEHVGERTDVVAGPADAAFSVPLALLWVQLGDRLRDLEVGASHTVQLLGPGLPPDTNVYAERVDVRRLPDTAAARHYAFALHRPNLIARGSFSCDPDALPIEITFEQPAPIRITARQE